MIECHIVSLFKEILPPYLDISIMKRAQEKGLFHYSMYNLADWSIRHTRRSDDRPYGWGAGTILMVEPLYNIIKNIEELHGTMKKIYFSPRGTLMNQSYVEGIIDSWVEKFLLICGHYEGIDERIFTFFDIEEISIGEYVLSSGELASLVWIDAIIRMIPGVIESESLKEESFSLSLDRKKEYPQYTRPETFLGEQVPPPLLSGNHATIREWKQKHTK